MPKGVGALVPTCRFDPGALAPEDLFGPLALLTYSSRMLIWLLANRRRHIQSDCFSRYHVVGSLPVFGKKKIFHRLTATSLFGVSLPD
jgi:hypothetical protein